MNVFSIIAPVFALIVIGYAAGYTRLLSEGAHKSLSEFAFGISVPALLFRTIVTTDFPALSPFRVWGAYFGAAAATWIIATAATPLLLRRPAVDSATIAMGSVYGNIVMLGIPLSLATFGTAAAGPLALIVAVHTPVLWLAGSLQIAWTSRTTDGSLAALALSLVKDLARNPIVLGIISGFVVRVLDVGLHPVADKALLLVAQAGVPTALVALGASLLNFRIAGQLPTLTSMCVLKLIVMPALAWWLAVEVLDLPPVAAGVVVLFAAMPSGANVYIFANRYQRVINSASGCVALGTFLSAFTIAALIGALLSMAR
jgi:hypothetical protein